MAIDTELPRPDGNPRYPSDSAIEGVSDADLELSIDQGRAMAEISAAADAAEENVELLAAGFKHQVEAQLGKAGTNVVVLDESTGEAEIRVTTAEAEIAAIEAERAQEESAA